jgi:hypothetical protein
MAGKHAYTVSYVLKDLLLTRGKATTLCCYRSHSQTAGTLDRQTCGGLRWWRRTVRASKNIHQCRQAAGKFLHILWSALCKSTPNSIILTLNLGFDINTVHLLIPTRLQQAHNHHRKYLESLPSTPYPLKPVGDPAEVPESQRVTDDPLGQR